MLNIRKWKLIVELSSKASKMKETFQFLIHFIPFIDRWGLYRKLPSSLASPRCIGWRCPPLDMWPWHTKLQIDYWLQPARQLWLSENRNKLKPFSFRKTIPNLVLCPGTSDVSFAFFGTAELHRTPQPFVSEASTGRNFVCWPGR